MGRAGGDGFAVVVINVGTFRYEWLGAEEPFAVVFGVTGSDSDGLATLFPCDCVFLIVGLWEVGDFVRDERGIFGHVEWVFVVYVREKRIELDLAGSRGDVLHFTGTFFWFPWELPLSLRAAADDCGLRQFSTAGACNEQDRQASK